jgi:WD40 repeat protein
VAGLAVGAVFVLPKLFESDKEPQLTNRDSPLPPKDTSPRPPKKETPLPPPEPVPVWTGHTAAILCLAISTRGDLAVSGSMSPENSVRLWNAHTGRLIKKCLDKFTDSICSVAVSPDGRYALMACGGYWKGNEYVRGTDYALRIWDLQTDREVTSKLVPADNREKKIPRLEGHTDEVYCVAYSADGQRAASCGRDNTVQLWDVTTGKQLHCLRGHQGTVYGVTFSPDGRRLLSAGSDHTVRLWDVSLGTEIHSFQGHTDIVWAVAFSPDGKYALSGSGLGFDVTKTSHGVPVFTPGTMDYTVRLWDLDARKEVMCLKGHNAVVNTVAFTPDGQRILSGSNDQTVRLWDAATGKLLHTFTGHTSGVRKVVVCPDGRRALSGSYDHTLRIWDLTNLDRQTDREAKLSAVLQGTVQPANVSELMDYALLAAYQKHLWVAAANLLLRSFADHPDWADHPAGGPRWAITEWQTPRFHAARCAILASSGVGDGVALPDAERTRWRKQAYDWLAAELEAKAKLLDQGPPEARDGIARQLQDWKTADVLANLREPALTRLLEDEQRACRKLWADWDALLARVQAPR